MDKLFRFMKQLDENKISFILENIRADYICVSFSTPGKKWEVEFSLDGEIEVEIFTSKGKTYGEEYLEQIFI